MKPYLLALAMIAVVQAAAPAVADSSHAVPGAKKINGDSPGDTAPLAGADKKEVAPLENANFPPPGGATMGAGPNPHETGPIDSDKAAKK